MPTILTVDPNGVINTLYDEDNAVCNIILHCGKLFNIKRVSEVSFDKDQKGWLADLTTIDGPLLGPFPYRRDAIKAEIEWLFQNYF